MRQCLSFDSARGLHQYHYQYHYQYQSMHISRFKLISGRCGSSARAGDTGAAVPVQRTDRHAAPGLPLRALPLDGLGRRVRSRACSALRPRCGCISPGGLGDPHLCSHCSRGVLTTAGFCLAAVASALIECCGPLLMRRYAVSAGLARSRNIAMFVGRMHNFDQLVDQHLQGQVGTRTPSAASPCCASP